MTSKSSFSPCLYFLTVILFLSGISAPAVQPVEIVEGPMLYFLPDASPMSDVLVAADFNSDGQTDLAVGGDTTVTILLNSNGVFSVRTNLLIVGPLSSGDFDGDGDVDLNAGSNLLFSNGDGTFSVQNHGFWGITSGDFDGNGLADLISYSGVLLLNQGSNVFTPSGSGISFPIGDFNNDGRTDAGSFDGWLFTSHRWDGQQLQSTTSEVSGHDASVCDFDGDGRDDVVISSRSDTFDLYTVGNNGILTLAHTLPSTSLEDVAIAGDIDGDGDNDLISYDARMWNRFFLVRLGTNGGSWSAPVQYEQMYGIHDMVLVDLDGDGKADPVMLGQDAWNISILEVVLSSKNELSRLALQPGWPMVRGDLNGDGRMDMVGFGPFASDRLLISLANTNGGLTQINHPCVNKRTESLPLDDFDKNGTLDVVIRISDGYQTLLGNGDGTFFTGPLLSETNDSTVLESADFNGDGNGDLVYLNGTAVKLGIGNGNGGFATPITIASNVYPPLKAADLNGDGKVDFVGGAYPAGLSVYLQGTNGNFVVANTNLMPSDQVRFLAVGDLNRDAREDIVATTDSTVSVLFQQSEGIFTAQTIYQGSSNELSTIFPIEIADLNVDGFADVHINDWYRSRSLFLLGSENSAFHPQTFTQSLVLLGDINLDQAPDFLSVVAVHPNITPSRPKISNLNWTDSSVQLTWTTTPGKTYQVQFSTNLVATNWISVGSNTVATNSTLSFTNNVPGIQQQFYRVMRLD